MWLKKGLLHNCVEYDEAAVTHRQEKMTAGDFQSAWWQCPVGPIWKAMIYSRAGPGKCRASQN